MLGFLFQRLTAPSALFDAITAPRPRAPPWYVECEIADTIDGRFAVLATLLALAIVRLDQLGDDGIRLGVALTERFVDGDGIRSIASLGWAIRRWERPCASWSARCRAGSGCGAKR